MQLYSCQPFVICIYWYQHEKRYSFIVVCPFHNQVGFVLLQLLLKMYESECGKCDSTIRANEDLRVRTWRMRFYHPGFLCRIPFLLCAKFSKIDCLQIVYVLCGSMIPFVTFTRHGFYREKTNTRISRLTKSIKTIYQVSYVLRTILLTLWESE